MAFACSISLVESFTLQDTELDCAKPGMKQESQLPLLILRTGGLLSIQCDGFFLLAGQQQYWTERRLILVLILA